MIGEMFQKIRDNGFVTKEDYSKMSEEQFKKLDTNGDGKITQEELQALIPSRRRGGDGGGGPPGGGAPGAGGPSGQGGQGGQGGGAGGFRRPAGPPQNPPSGT